MYRCTAMQDAVQQSYYLFTLTDGPVCTQGRQTVTAIEGETVELDCNVDANPGNVTFYWTFNNTVDSTQFRENEVRAHIM